MRTGAGASWEDQDKTNFQPLTHLQKPQTKKWSRRVHNSSPVSRATDANTTDEPRVRVMRTGRTPLSIEEFMLDTRLFDINMKPYDGQNTLGPWQTMTTVTDTNDINVRVREAVDYVRSNCNPNCPTPRENAQCENPFEDPRNEYCKQDGDCPVTVIFDSPNLNWCGCATTPWADPNKQTMGYSGRCSQGAGDYYTKYKDLATQICNRA